MKRTALFLAGILAISSFSGCGAKNSASDSSEPFEGKYVVTADYVKENLDDIIVVDARGEDEAKKGTVKGAVATTWQYLATCEDGEAGDANWGCILDTKRLSERLGELGLAKDKEIVLFSNAEKGWGEDGRIAWELIAAGYEDVKIVDGGIKALKAAGVETVKGAAEPKPVSVEIDSIDETHVINTDELKEIYDDCKIVDTRTDKEYNGKTMYGEANGGHLPGAIQIRYTDLFNSGARGAAKATQLLKEAGITNVFTIENGAKSEVIQKHFVTDPVADPDTKKDNNGKDNNKNQNNGKTTTAATTKTGDTAPIAALAVAMLAALGAIIAFGKKKIVK